MLSETLDVVGAYSLADLSSVPDPMRQLQEIANRAIDILQQIHKRGIVHKDIKPQHLVFFRNDLFLIDYGSAGPAGTESTFSTAKYASTDSYFGILVCSLFFLLVTGLILQE